MALTKFSRLSFLFPSARLGIDASNVTRATSPSSLLETYSWTTLDFSVNEFSSFWGDFFAVATRLRMTRRRAVRGLVRPMIGDVVRAVGNLPKPPQGLRHLPSKPIFVKSLLSEKRFCLLPTSDDPNCQMKTREKNSKIKRRIDSHKNIKPLKRVLLLLLLLLSSSLLYLRREGRTDARHLSTR